ncbi:hypothetical protein AQ1_02591 [alpha proteobacterium Q-1]|uniref:hypothetical protein n=1 Tax=Iodidimonas nitroreducens TaxID=1236968 RepID=UPI00049F0D03|nr:hypothetical protein [Iodidimonas nitroreducens]GAK34689.1 hypothetical protein AQ1_02591 [alpha proteobacterium Q-1]
MLADQHYVTIGAFIRLRLNMGFDIPVETWRYLFGIPTTTWEGFLRDARHRHQQFCPMAPHIAITARWVAQHRQVYMPLLLPSATDLFSRINAVLERPLTRQTFGMAFGYNSTRGYGWLLPKTDPRRATKLAFAMIDHPSPNRLKENWQKWQANAKLEARLRGITDLDRVLRWTEPTQEILAYAVSP